MTSPEQLPIHEHDTQIIPYLVAQLPSSCSVLRRIQHAVQYPSPTAKILATFPPGASPEQPWLAAHVDLFRGRETQIVVYSSLEADHTANVPLTSSSQPDAEDDLRVSTLDASPTVLAQARAQLLSLLSHIKADLRPAYLSSVGEPVTHTAPQQNENLIPPPDPRAFLFGSLHTGLFELLCQPGAYLASEPLPCLRIHRIDNPPYYKYIFPRSKFNPDGQNGLESTLPAGYQFHDRNGREGVLPSQFDLVQSRTHIPRSRKQLQSMPSAAIYYAAPGPESDVAKTSDQMEDENPVGWAFIGHDGALATLHVEPEHRGRGLALQLSKEAMRRGMDPEGVFGAGGDGFAPKDGRIVSRPGDWAHTEVAQKNQASRRVMEKIGGQVMSTVMWAVIELLD